MIVVSESWQYNPNIEEAEILGGCQFGLEVDHRCNGILCKFRCRSYLAPKEIHRAMSVMCPREMEHELEQAAVICGR